MFKSFQTKVVQYLVVILLAMMGIAYVYINEIYSFTLMLLVPLLIIMVWSLFKLVNKTNTDFVQFLSGIKYDDVEQSFAPNQLGESHRDLYESFNLITEKIRTLRSEKEASDQLMQTIIGNVDTGIFCTNEKGDCLMINTAMKQLMHRSYIPDFQAFKEFTPNLYQALTELELGERKIIKETIQNEILQIAIQLFVLKVKDEEIKVYTFYNIHNELSDQEVVSWQKLIRILAHEIMNSIAPIASLSSSAAQLIPEDNNIDAEDAEELKEVFSIISRRSDGLMKFTETYRKLTRIPPPQLQSINMNSFFREIKKLFNEDLKKNNINWNMKFLYHEIKLMADPILLEQVFINLLKNAIQALEGRLQPEITILVDKTPNGKVNIQVIDNGAGIPQDVVDQIFVPFFTTKENGSGIGLSLSQQIIRAHGGSIYLQSKEGEGTMITMSI